MAETYPIAIHWTCHGMSKSSCVVRNSLYYSSSSLFSTHHSNTPSHDNNNYNNNNNSAANSPNNNNNYNNSYINISDPAYTNTVDGVMVVYVEGRDITCTISSSTLRVVHPRELVHFIKNYFRFL